MDLPSAVEKLSENYPFIERFARRGVIAGPSRGSIPVCSSYINKNRLAAVCYLWWSIVKYAMAMDLVTKNPCEFCKPPKIQRKKVNALSREERTRMMKLARKAEPAPLGLAIELALTTGMRRGEICGLRWSDLGDCEVTVNRALAFSGGTLYVKEPKTTESCRTIPLTQGCSPSSRPRGRKPLLPADLLLIP